MRMRLVALRGVGSPELLSTTWYSSVSACRVSSVVSVTVTESQAAAQPEPLTTRRMAVARTVAQGRTRALRRE